MLVLIPHNHIAVVPPSGGSYELLPFYLIREIPDHATSREKVQILGWLDKPWVFSLWTYVIMSTLTICSFQGILFSKNVNINKKYIEYSLSHDVTQLRT